MMRFKCIRMLTCLTLGTVVLGVAGGLSVAAEPPLADAVRNMPANQWNEIVKDDGAGCFGSGTVYMPTVNAFLSWGTRVHSKKATRHDTCHIRMQDAKIVDALPPGKEDWEPKGQPGWKLGGVVTFRNRDGVSLPRRILSHEQLAWDGANQRVVYHIGNTFAYDPVQRAWHDLGLTNGPPHGLEGAAMCYDAAEKRIVLFGGFGVEEPYGESGTWYFDVEKNVWSQPSFGHPKLGEALKVARELGVRARTLRRDAQYGMGLTGTDAQKAEAALRKDGATLAKQITALAQTLSARGADWSASDKARAKAGAELVKAAAASVAKGGTLQELERVAALETAEDILFYRAVDALRTQPPPRCNTDMVYDSKRGLVVLFGGDHLDMKLNDTWALDTARNVWTRRQPSLSPPPQSVHSMAFLEKSGKVFLAGRKGNWIYDIADNRWRPVPGKTPGSAAFRVDAIPGTDIVIGLATFQWTHNLSVYAYRLDAATAEAEHKGMTENPEPPLAASVWLSRKWYDDLPAPDPEAFQAKIAALPENTWTPLPSEKRIKARTWSSCTYDTRRRELIYWGGGHSGNVNGNVDHFSMRTGRWSRNLDSTFKPWPYGAKAACPKGRTYYDEPWTMHARKTYAYDPVSGLVAMAYVGGGGWYRKRSGKSGRYTWLYDPRSGAWADRIDTPFKCGYNGAAVTTPHGVLLLDRGQVWKLDVANRTWEKVGNKQKMGGGEYNSLVYDSKRDRLIYLADDIHYFPLESKVWEKAGVEGIGSRDAVYIPGQDAVLAHVGSGKFKALICDPERIVDGPAGNFKGTRKGISEHAVTMDPETETVLWIDAHGFCGPFTLKALKLNVAALK